MTDVTQNLARVRESMAEAALRRGRDPADVTLVAVTKTRTPDEVVAACQAGVVHVGENRVEEATPKIPAVHAVLAGQEPTWHMVGHVQSRKAQDVVAQFDYVDAVDRLKLARRLSRFAGETGKTVPVLLECNVSGEEAKFGFDLSGWERDEGRRRAFFAAVEEVLALPGLAVQGLMTMAPLVEDPETVRPVLVVLAGSESGTVQINEVGASVMRVEQSQGVGIFSDGARYMLR